MWVDLLRSLYANRWVRYAVTLALLVVVVARVRPGQLAGAVSTAAPGTVLLALALTVPFLYLKATRWHLMLDAAGIEVPFSEAVLSLIGGMGLALVTPARLGEVVRAAYLRDSRKLEIGGLVLLDKGFDVLTLAGLSVAGAWILIGPLLGVLLAAITVAGLCVVYRPKLPSTAIRAGASRLPLAARLERVLSVLDSLTPRTTTIFLVLTLASFVVVLLQFGIVLSSWHRWSLEVVALTFPLVILTNVVPITVAGLGIREGAAVLLLSHYGVSPAHAALAAFLMFFLNTALPGIAGAVLFPLAPSLRKPIVHPDGP